MECSDSTPLLSGQMTNEYNNYALSINPSYGTTTVDKGVMPKLDCVINTLDQPAEMLIANAQMQNNIGAVANTVTDVLVPMAVLSNSRLNQHEREIIDLAARVRRLSNAQTEPTRNKKSHCEKYAIVYVYILFLTVYLTYEINRIK